MKVYIKYRNIEYSKYQGFKGPNSTLNITEGNLNKFRTTLINNRIFSEKEYDQWLRTTDFEQFF